MRKWMNDRFKKRKKPSENLTEQTGKVGQAIDASKPAPLVPSYTDAPPAAPARREVHAEHKSVATPLAVEAAAHGGKLEVETQSESPNSPSLDSPITKQPQQKAPKGVVV